MRKDLENENRLDAPEDLQSSDVINNITASKLKGCFFTDGCWCVYVATLNAQMCDLQKNKKIKSSVV